MVIIMTIEYNGLINIIVVKVKELYDLLYTFSEYCVEHKIMF